MKTNKYRKKVEKSAFCNYRNIWFKLESLMFIMVWIWNVPWKVHVLKSWLSADGVWGNDWIMRAWLLSGFIHWGIHDLTMFLGRDGGSGAKRYDFEMYILPSSLPFSLSLCFLSGSSLPCPPITLFCLATSQWRVEPMTLETLETVSPYCCFSQHVSHRRDLHSWEGC